MRRVKHAIFFKQHRVNIRFRMGNNGSAPGRRPLPPSINWKQGRQQYTLRVGRKEFDGLENLSVRGEQIYLGGESDPRANQCDVRTVRARIVDLEPDPNEAEYFRVCTTSCKIKINGPCNGDPNMKDSPWFDDQSQGGPKPSTNDKCEQRRDYWKQFCDNDDVEFKFTDPQSGKKCEIKIDGTCEQYSGMSNHDWFDDSTKGGPAATTDDACEARKRSWENSCSNTATVTYRFIPPC